MSQVTESIRDRAVNALPGGVTRSTVFVPPHPPYAVRGAGARVFDIEGHEVLDANNNYTSLIHGHAHPRLVEAATRAIANGTAFGLPTPSEIELAEALGSRTGIPHWRFCNSGTEAVMMAIRCARAFTRRDLIVRFSGSYHGAYDDVVDASAPGIPASTSHDVLVLPQGDAAAFEQAMREHGRRVAAVLVDLMPNRAGLRPAAPEFADLLRRRTQADGALLIVDEIITLRTAVGGMSSRYGIAPDIMTVGKIIGGGFPAGGIGGPREVLRPFVPSSPGAVSWGGTFSANPVTMSVGRASLDLLDAAAIARINAAGDALRSRLEEAGVAAAGFGSLLRLSFGRPEDWWTLYHRGLLVCANGLVALSTAMSDDDVDRIGGIIVDTLGPAAR